MQHIPVLLEAIKKNFPSKKEGTFLDLTYGGGGHFFALLEKFPDWSAEGWDQDPLAEDRFNARRRTYPSPHKVCFKARNFAEKTPDPFDFILADLGVSSFQLDDEERGMSFRWDSPVDFRMNPNTGTSFSEWLSHTSEEKLYQILEEYGEEPKAKKLAHEMKSWNPSIFESAKQFSEKITHCLKYTSKSRTHPATRTFQALRIAINDEMGVLSKMLQWAPLALKPGGRLAIIAFHSTEDRLVKNHFRDLAKTGHFDILYKKPLIADEEEVRSNPRARSAKLRIIERIHLAENHPVST